MSITFFFQNSTKKNCFNFFLYIFFIFDNNINIRLILVKPRRILGVMLNIFRTKMYMSFFRFIYFGCASMLFVCKLILIG